MSDVKRPKLISFGSQRVNGKSSKECPKTFRISVNLPESTEDKCPEYNYKDLFAVAKKRHAVQKNLAKQVNGLDPFADEDDDDVRRIAAEMEAKYGMGASKKRKWKKDDYADIGMGYDESDSFIDNTDGYDEIIPKNVTTLHGGFYINCGALEFKTDEDVSSDESSSSSSEEEEEVKSANRKRIIESSASGEETETEKTGKVEQQDKKPKLLTSTNGMQKAIKKRLFSHDKIKHMRKKRGLPPVEESKKTVRELLRERREDLNMTVMSELDTPEKKDHDLSPKAKKPPASVEDAIESVVLKAANKSRDVDEDDSSRDSTSSKDTPSKSVLNSSEADSNDGVHLKPVEVVALPENLPSDIIEILDGIKKAAATSTEGKVKFFSGNVNTMLLDLERQCRCLGKQSRMRVYEHLAPFVKCRKETLIKRAKNLLVLEEQKKINKLLDRLKQTVNAAMPPLIENYSKECKIAIERRKMLTPEQAKVLPIPRRSFSWSDEMKKLLSQIIFLKKKCFINQGRQKSTIEKHLSEFVKTDIYIIWPEKWISFNMLLRVCNLTLSSESRKSIEMHKTPSSSPAELTISPVNISPVSVVTPSSLTITPVTVNSHKDNKMKPKVLGLDTTISKVGLTDSICVKTNVNNSLPPVDIVQTDVNSTIKTPIHIKDESEIVIEENSLEEKPEIKAEVLINNADDKIKLEDMNISPALEIEVKTEVKQDDPEDLSLHTIRDTSVIRRDSESSTTHYKVVDLTEQSDLRKKLAPKSKMKLVFDLPEKPKPKKDDLISSISVKSKEQLTGSSVYNQLIADSLSDKRFTPKLPTSNDTVLKKVPTYDYTKPKTNEGDDIQKVMEGLKVLQKMSSPVKTSHDELTTGSPVSVIAFNKSFAHDANNSTPLAAHRTASFQDAFQKQFIPDYHLMRAQHATSPSKGGAPNSSKHNHTLKSAPGGAEYQNSNHNYAQQNVNKLKNSSAHQSGSYNMLDDMFANFLNEYGYAKTANAKSSTPHK